MKQIAVILLTFLLSSCSTDEEKFSKYKVAIENKDYSKAESIIKDPKIALYKTVTGETPLIIAIENDNLDLVKILIKKGADVNNITSSFRTPLLKTKSLNIAKELVSNGANYNYNSPNYGTVLHTAVRKDIELLSYYLKLGVDVNLKAKVQQVTALDVAYKKNVDKTIIELLKKYNANSSFTDDFDSELYDSLESAVAFNNIEKTHKYLNMNVTFDYSLFDKAVRYGSTECVKILLKKKNLIDRSILDNITYSGVPSELALILIENAKLDDLNEIDEDGGTLLHSCVVMDRLDLIKALVKHGADISIKATKYDRKNLTPLEYAKKKGNKELVTYFQSLKH
ncbi:hypothetical protein LNTAR_13032 [Lentisphaera araneosa HTCC2155]|uniref:Uncharacterized protein n=1 Tax=Lentisphaera araneosa HTCC2155 TaxID=313628 RepID=A6DRK5_9BACT|nr:ankyrin repeat domain-containing protein [Lentisphaera araneosa]EDM25674.1 hypothetical protein LNTAR_13032 [Lentisphaera araneosa HTCC2155]